MGDAAKFPGERRIPSPAGSGGAPEDPMLNPRVDALEQKRDQSLGALHRLELAVRDIASELNNQRKHTHDIALKAATIDGRPRNIPTWFQLYAALITTWAAGAAIVFTLTRLVKP
ncbi:MAG: ribonuclease [Ancalomicrobiaceae bacterium]|nr:ribonuclease [Ancalomicrobiaceae bacterium]